MEDPNVGPPAYADSHSAAHEPEQELFTMNDTAEEIETKIWLYENRFMAIKLHESNSSEVQHTGMTPISSALYASSGGPRVRVVYNFLAF